MFDLKPNYVTDSANNKVAVQLTIKTFEKIEEVLENYSLYQFMEEGSKGDVLKVEEAKEYYKKLKKKK